MTPSQAAEGVVSEERLEHLAVMHFNIDFLPDRQEFIDIQIALRELQHLRRLSTQNTEGWRPIESAPRDGTRILACNADPKANYTIVGYFRGMQFTDGHWPMIPVTHWHPLLPPPTLASRDVP